MNHPHHNIRPHNSILMPPLHIKYCIDKYNTVQTAFLGGSEGVLFSSFSFIRSFEYIFSLFLPTMSGIAAGDVATDNNAPRVTTDQAANDDDEADINNHKPKTDPVVRDLSRSPEGV